VRGGEQIAFGHILKSPYPRRPRAARFADVGEASFGLLATLALQSSSPRAACSLAVGVDRRFLLGRFTSPGAVVLELRLGDVRAASEFFLERGDGLVL